MNQGGRAETAGRLEQPQRRDEIGPSRARAGALPHFLPLGDFLGSFAGRCEYVRHFGWLRFAIRDRIICSKRAEASLDTVIDL